MRMRARAVWVAFIAVGIVPIGLALAPREDRQASRTSWRAEGRGEARFESIGAHLVLSGTVRAANQTTVIPELEQLAGVPSGFGVMGMTLPTRLIRILPEGSIVRKGEEICRFDSTEYEEAARLQRIDVDRARSFRAEAERDLSVAEAELTAFRDGERVQQERRLETELAFAKVELSRAEDSLSWSDRMGTLGYVSPADLEVDRLSRLRAEVNRDKAEVALATFLRSTVAKQLRGLEAQVERAKVQLAFAVEGLQAAESRLEHVNAQVSHCSLRAPHDGTVIYADTNWREYYQVREGADVYPGLPLVVLPDLSSLEVEVQIHERYSSFVSEGQRAIVAFEAFPGRSCTARVVSMDLLPQPDWYHFGEWQQFRVLLALEDSADWLLPGMTASVELAIGPDRRALTVPAEAVSWDGGGPFCVVRSPDGPTRRAVRVDRGSVDRLVVLDGLDPGEVVLLRPIPIGTDRERGSPPRRRDGPRRRAGRPRGRANPRMAINQRC